MANTRPYLLASSTISYFCLGDTRQQMTLLQVSDNANILLTKFYGSEVNVPPAKINTLFGDMTYRID